MKKPLYGVSPAYRVLKDIRKLNVLMAERQVKEYLLKKVKRMKGEARKVRWEGRRKAPDWRVMLPGHKSFWLELKATGKKPTRAQAREMRLMEKLGEEVHWANSPMMIDIVIANMRHD